MVELLPYQVDDPIVSGVVLLFAAIGLLASYAIARRTPTGAGQMASAVRS